MAPKTAAELALEKKFELLRKKKEQQALQQRQAAAGGDKPGAGAAVGTAAAATAAADNALERVKAQLAQKNAAKAKAAEVAAAKKAAAADVRKAVGVAARGGTPPAAEARPPPEPTPQQRLEALKKTLAEKRAREAAAAAAGTATAAAPKRPAVKRPTIKRPPLAAGAGGGDPAAKAPRLGDEGQHSGPSSAAGPHTGPGAGTASSAAPPEPPAAATACSLFVGDLPPGTTAADVADLFSTLASVADASVVAGAAYGFVALESAADVDAVLDLVARNPLVLHGRPLRVARALGPGAAPRGWPGQGPGGGPGGPPPTTGADPAASHPRALEAREAARTIAKQVGPGADFAAPGRELVSYDDL